MNKIPEFKQTKSIRRRLRWVLASSVLFLVCSSLIFAYFYEKSLKTVDNTIFLGEALEQVETAKEIIVTLSDELNSGTLFSSPVIKENFSKKVSAAKVSLNKAALSLGYDQDFVINLDEAIAVIGTIESIGGELFASQEREHIGVVKQLSLEIQQSLNKLRLNIRNELNISYADIQRQRFHPLYINAGITIALSLFLFLFGFITIRRINTFIKNHLKAAQLVAQGKTDFQIPLGDTDELGRLTSAFNKMSKDFGSIKLELERSNQDLEDFAHMASHDLRAPLRHIKVFAKMFIEEKDKADINQLNKISDNIAISVDQSLNLLDELLKFSQIGRQALESESIDLNETVKKIIEQCQVQNSVFSIKMESLPRIKAYPPLIGLIFQNIIENAIKYSPKDRVSIHVQFQDKKDYWEFSVSDQGFGIPDEQKELAFTLFQRLDHGGDKIKGTGAGLAICRKIVEAHGGKIWIEDNHPQGSQFKWTVAKDL